MFEFIILLSVIIAPFTVLLAFLLNCVQNLKFRNHLPLVCGIIIVAILLLINPQQEPGIEGRLYDLKAWSQYLLLPLFYLRTIALH
jgi:H+/Cl- antiporter ClcA